MIIGMGIDIADQTRFQRSLDRQGERIIQRIFTENEIVICQRYRKNVEHFAGKFAVKEAFMKAIGKETAKIEFKEIEVLNQENGAPYILTHGKAKEAVEKLGITKIHISISHDANIAAAVVILEN
jgi:holo-[acyl-carrier protein] synthase